MKQFLAILAVFAVSFSSAHALTPENADFLAKEGAIDSFATTMGARVIVRQILDQKLVRKASVRRALSAYLDRSSDVGIDYLYCTGGSDGKTVSCYLGITEGKHLDSKLSDQKRSTHLNMRLLEGRILYVNIDKLVTDNE